MSIVSDMDYSAASPLEVTFTSGIAMQGDTSCAQLSIIDDTTFEGPHSFSMEVSMLEIESDGTDPLLTIGTMSSATVNIVDNDGINSLVPRPPPAFFEFMKISGERLGSNIT